MSRVLKPGRAFRPGRMDLLISAAIATGFPFLAGYLYTRTGALLPAVLYYGLAWGITRWRRGSTGYFNTFTGKPPVWFSVNMGIIGASLGLAYIARVEVTDPDPLGVAATAVVWATINAASEQLLWIYIFESWDLYGTARSRQVRITFRIVGLVLFAVFVGAIHMLYWARFLHTVNPSMFAGLLFVILTTVSGFLHLVVWRQGGQMVYTFIPHFLLNLVPLFWTGYSIGPYL